jgi:hypothetical protein
MNSSNLKRAIKDEIEKEVDKLQEEFEERQEEKRKQKQEQLDEVLKSFDFEKFGELQEEEEEEFNYEEVFDEILEQKTLWDKMNIIRKYVIKENMWAYGKCFDIKTGQGTSDRTTQLGIQGRYTLSPLEHYYNDIFKVLEDIHKCLEKHDSVNIDYMFINNPSGLMIILSTNDIIDNVLFYRSYVGEGRDKQGFRETHSHFDTHNFPQILQFALEFDYIIRKKEVISWETYVKDDEEITQLLKQMINEGKNFNYSHKEARTKEEVEEDRRREQEEQAKIRQQQQAQQQQQQMMAQVQQELQEFEKKKQTYDMLLQMQQQQQLFQQQMALLMEQYRLQQQQQQEEEFDEEYEEFEDEEEFEEDEE